MATFGTTNKYINYSVNSQELSYDINSNTSVVRVWIDVWRTNTGYTTYGNGTVYARINGTVYSAGIGTGQKITSSAIRLGTWDVTVGHNSDGSKSIGVSGWISHDRFSSSENGYTHTLTTIPRQANITDSPTTFKDTDNPWFKYSNPGNFNMECWLEPNPNGEHYAKRTLSGTSGTFTWELTNDERKQLREACKCKTCTIRIGLYSNNCSWASYHDRTYQMTNAEPTINSVVTSIIDPFGSLCLQNRSNIKFTISATAKYGATITNYAVSGNNFSYAGSKNTCQTSNIRDSGSLKYTVTVTDSRGFTASTTKTINVTGYSYPTISMEAFRSNSSGTKDVSSGTYICVKPVFTYSAITGNSIASKAIKINNISKSTSFSSEGSYVFSGYSLNDSYDVVCTVTDSVGNSASITATITGAKIPFNISKNKDAIGLGTVAKYEGYINIGYGFCNENGEQLFMFGVTDNYDDD